MRISKQYKACNVFGKTEENLIKRNEITPQLFSEKNDVLYNKQ